MVSPPAKRDTVELREGQAAELVESLAAALEPLGVTRESRLEALPGAFEKVAGRPLDRGDDYDVAVANAALRRLHPDD